MKAITVSQLNNYIKQVFEAEELLHSIEVVGDIDAIRQTGGAVFFTLKDENATIPCVCYYPQKLKNIENGSQVVVRGTVSYWHKAGKISFIITHCESFGFGALFLRFQQLKEKLEKEGFFDVGTKKSLPTNVKRIGVVTSKTGAVIRDIITVAHRRNPAVDIVLYPTAVQGTGSDAEIEAAINFFANPGGIKPVDLIIVARGGGSKEDLAAFDTERVARAVFACKIPVVAAVGHETDWTLIDFVADMRAATPSAAAELCVPEAVTRREILIRAYKHLRYVTKNKYDTNFTRTRTAYTTLRAIMLGQLAEIENGLANNLALIEQSNPIKILERGFAKVFGPRGEVRGIGDVQTGDMLRIKLYNGELDAQIQGKRDVENNNSGADT